MWMKLRNCFYKMIKEKEEQMESIIKKIKKWGNSIEIVENKNMDIYMNKKKFEEMQSILDELKLLVKQK